MKSDESISNIYIRFINIVNALRNLGKELTIHTLSKKYLKLLLKSWNLKAIARDLSIGLDKLVVSLVTHKMTFSKKVNDKKKGMALSPLHQLAKKLMIIRRIIVQLMSKIKINL